MDSKIFSLIIQPFLSGNYDDFQYYSAFSFDYDDKTASIFVHGEKTIWKDKKDQIFIELNGNENLTVNLLNAILGISAILKGSNIHINGIEWDGKKTNLQLFID